MADPNMELIRQLREAMEDEGFTPTTDNGWVGTVSDVARLARDLADLTAHYESDLAAARAGDEPRSAEAGDTDA